MGMSQKFIDRVMKEGSPEAKASLVEQLVESVDGNEWSQPHDTGEKNPNRVAGGVVAQAAGASFEEETFRGQSYLVGKDFYLSRTFPKMEAHNTGSGFAFHAVRGAKGPCDAVGAALDGRQWRPVGFEIKSTKNKTLYSVAKSRLHQFDYLRAMWAMDGPKFIGYLIEFREFSQVRWAPLWNFEFEIDPLTHETSSAKVAIDATYVLPTRSWREAFHKWTDGKI